MGDPMEAFICVICLERPLIDPVTVPCGHSFDQDCFKELIRIKRLPCPCPVCRATIEDQRVNVSVSLRDAITKLFPEEAGTRREHIIWERLTEGHADKDTFSYISNELLARLGGSDSNTHAIVLMLKKFILNMKLDEKANTKTSWVLADLASVGLTLSKQSVSNESFSASANLLSGLLDAIVALLDAAIISLPFVFPITTEELNKKTSCIAAYEAVGNLIWNAGAVLSNEIPVWDNLRRQLRASLETDPNLEVVTGAAHVARALLNARLLPEPRACAPWFLTLWQTTCARLQTSVVAANSFTSRELLTLLGDLYRCVPVGEAMNEITHSGRFTSSCSLVLSAGHAVRASDVNESRCHVALGVLGAWNGIVSFLMGLPAHDVEECFSPWVEGLAEFLVVILTLTHGGETLESLNEVFGNVLQLAKQVGGFLASALFSRFQPHSALLHKVRGTAKHSRSLSHAEFLASSSGSH